MHLLFAKADRLAGEFGLKAIRDVLPIQKALFLSYMELLNVPLERLLNLHEVKLVDGISRLVLPGANRP